MDRTARGSSRNDPPGTDRLTDWLILAPLLLTTFLGKWAIPSGVRGVGMSVPLILLVLCFGLVTRRLRFDLHQLSAYLLLVATLGVFQLFGDRDFSAASLLLMATLYFAYTVSAGVARPGARNPLHDFADVGSVIAVCGIVQFAAQFVLPYNLVFPIETMLPPQLLVEGYNTQIPLYFGAKVYKANGFFCLEPSFFSQLLAVSLIVELTTRNRLTRIVLFVMGLVVSYSGTGMVVLLVCLPVIVISRRRWDLVALGVILLVMATLLSDKLNLDLFLSRVGEFSDRRTSGFERFVGGFFLFDQYLWTSPIHAMTGYGAGTFSTFASRAENNAAEMTLFKVVFEYGLVGAVLYFGFLFYVVLRGAAPPVVKVAVLIAYFLSSIYVPTPHGFALTLLVWSHVGGPVAGRRRVEMRAPSLTRAG